MVKTIAEMGQMRIQKCAVSISAYQDYKEWSQNIQNTWKAPAIPSKKANILL